MSAPMKKEKVTPQYHTLVRAQLAERLLLANVHRLPIAFNDAPAQWTRETYIAGLTNVVDAFMEAFYEVVEE